MEQRAYLELIRMLEGFPQKSGNPDLTISAYELAVDGLLPQAVIDAAQRFNGGLVEGQSVDFAPAPPRFAQEARRLHDHIKLQAKPKQEALTYHRGPLAPFEIARQKALTKFQDCPILHKDISHAEFMAFSKAGQIPVGAVWSAATCNVYGGEAEQISMGRRKQA